MTCIRKDRTGQRVGYIEAIRDIGVCRPVRCRLWLCRCVLCGSEITRPSYFFAPSQGKYRDRANCGCEKNIPKQRPELFRPAERQEVFGDKTNRQIADELGITISALKKRMQRGWSYDRILSTYNLKLGQAHTVSKGAPTSKLAKERC